MVDYLIEDIDELNRILLYSQRRLLFIWLGLWGIAGIVFLGADYLAFLEDGIQIIKLCSAPIASSPVLLISRFNSSMNMKRVFKELKRRAERLKVIPIPGEYERIRTTISEFNKSVLNSSL